jgi:plasmid stability protein
MYPIASYADENITSQAVEHKPMVRTATNQERTGLTVLRIDTPLAQRLKVAAANERKSMKALAEEYISRGLVQREVSAMQQQQQAAASGMRGIAASAYGHDL